MTCEHVDCDDYFEKCNDCEMTGAQIHATECVPADDFHITEEGTCSRCGTLADSLSEGEAA